MSTIKKSPGSTDIEIDMTSAVVHVREADFGHMDPEKKDEIMAMLRDSRPMGEKLASWDDLSSEEQRRAVELATEHRQRFQFKQMSIWHRIKATFNL